MSCLTGERVVLMKNYKNETNNDFDREDEEIKKAYIGFGLGL